MQLIQAKFKVEKQCLKSQKQRQTTAAVPF